MSSLSRTLTMAAVTGLGTLVTALVAADRLAHAPPPAPVRIVALVEAQASPAATVTQQVPRAAARPARLLDGFDTERLNALMRGDPSPPAGRR